MKKLFAVGLLFVALSASVQADVVKSSAHGVKVASKAVGKAVKKSAKAFWKFLY
jgi:hypothetical protein